MSIESILRCAKPGKRKKRAVSSGGITAHDSKFTGLSPDWTGCEFWTGERFYQERSRGLDFYAYYSQSGSMKSQVCDWMEFHGYSKEDIRAVKRAPDWSPGTTTGSLCSMMNLGMMPLHPGVQDYMNMMPGLQGVYRSDELFVREAIAESIKEGKKTAEETQVVAASSEPAISPMERLRQKVQSTIIMDLDVMLDSWMTAATPITPLPIYEKMKAHSLPGAACPQIRTWLEHLLHDMTAALDKTDTDLIQGYAYLTTAQLRSRVEALKTMLEDLNKHVHTIKAARAPRAKKVHSAVKQVSHLKYLKHDPELKLTSVNPVRLIGAFRVLVYNVKYRALIDYTSSTGFTMKGTTLCNVESARGNRLRKPEEFISTAMNSTPKQLQKAWEGLTTKEFKPKNRINGECILLRVFEQAA